MATFLTTLKQRSLTVLPTSQSLTVMDLTNLSQTSLLISTATFITVLKSCSFALFYPSQILTVSDISSQLPPSSRFSNPAASHGSTQAKSWQSQTSLLFSAATFFTVLKSCSFTWFCPSQSACVSLSPEVFMNPVSSQFANGCQLEQFHMWPPTCSQMEWCRPHILFFTCAWPRCLFTEMDDWTQGSLWSVLSSFSSLSSFIVSSRSL